MPETPDTTSRTAVSSLIMGLLGFFSFGTTAILGLMLGITVLAQAHAGNERVVGRTIAIWGVISSSLALLLVPLVILMWFFPRNETKVDPARMSVTQKEALLVENLAEIREAITHFYFDTGAFPGKLEDLVAVDSSEVTAIIPNGTYHGPYLPTRGGIGNTGIPVNPFARGAREISEHWRYEEGRLNSAVQGNLLDGRTFREL